MYPVAQEFFKAHGAERRGGGRAYPVAEDAGPHALAGGGEELGRILGRVDAGLALDLQLAKARELRKPGASHKLEGILVLIGVLTAFAGRPAQRWTGLEGGLADCQDGSVLTWPLNHAGLPLHSTLQEGPFSCSMPHRLRP